MLPRELYAAKKSALGFWVRADLIINEHAGVGDFDTAHVIELQRTGILLDTVASDLYDAWQELDGQSNCESITAEQHMREVNDFCDDAADFRLQDKARVGL